MQDTFFIRDLETMKALSDPRRVEILGLLQKPRTTRQVADVLGETANAMYYHILELEKCGLIRVVKTAMKGHLQEKYYQAAARFYVPAADLFESRFDAYKTETLETLQDMQETAIAELHTVSLDPVFEENLAQSCFMAQKPLRLSAERQAQFRQRLDALIREFVDDGSDGDGGRLALLTTWLFPLSAAAETQAA